MDSYMVNTVFIGMEGNDKISTYVIVHVIQIEIAIISALCLKILFFTKMNNKTSSLFDGNSRGNTNMHFIER